MTKSSEDFVAGNPDKPELPATTCQGCKFEVTDIPESFDKDGNPVFNPDAKIKKSNIGCMSCDKQWFRVYENGVYSFRSIGDVSALDFLKTVHKKDLLKDSYIPEIPTHTEYQEKMLNTMTQYEKDLILLSDAWHKRELQDNEFVLLMRERWPNVELDQLLTDMEQFMDPEHKRGVAGDYYFYFSRKK